MIPVNVTMQNWRASDGQLLRGAPRWLAERSFRQNDIPAARRFTRAFGARARLDPARLGDFVLAVSEATASATARGPGSARVRLWVTGTRAFCEVRGDGIVARRTTHEKRQSEEEALRRWVLQRLADYVSVVSGPDGVWVLLSMKVS